MYGSDYFLPAYKPSSGVRTPLALHTALLEKEPEPGYA